ncbi:hypothetical protein B566_EDAN009949 [Ephemera danica]|nr:hypothetical protein B566_EDAN009949 [Ephemera danica]
MFNFMKKGSSGVAGEKERSKNKEKKRSSRGDRLSADELLRLDEVRRSLKLRGKRSHKEKLPSGITADYSASFLAGLIDPPPSPPPPAAPASDSSDASLSSHLQPPPPAKIPPALPPKPPKRGILKTGGRPPPPAPPLVSPPEEEVIRNTLTNERISIPRRASADLGSTEFVSAEFATPRSSGSLASDSISFATPPRGSSPDQALLPLPPAEPAPLPAPRHLVIRRQPRGDFGFSLRRAIVTVREAGTERRVAVILAEPGSNARQLNDTGLLPGDRLLAVNGESVDDKSRDEVIQLIKSSGNTVTVTVQPVAELQELTRRSAPDGGPDQQLAAQHIAGGTLRRSGSCLNYSQLTDISASPTVESKELRNTKVKFDQRSMYPDILLHVDRKQGWSPKIGLTS